MIRRARKILRGGVIYGVVLTLAVIAARGTDPMNSLERWFYDRRARDCQFFTPPPTDRLVHLDIDDAAIDAVGDWPWRRSTLAEMVDEIHLAGPKTMAWDVVFDKPQEVRYVPAGDGKQVEIDDDEAFAAALKRLDCVLMPLSLPQDVPQAVTPLQRALREVLGKDLELNEIEAVDAVKRLGVSPAAPRQFVEAFLQMRREVMGERVMGELKKAALNRDQVREILLPKTNRNLQSPAVRLLDEQYAQAQSQLDVLRFTRPLPPGLQPPLHAMDIIAPIPAISKASRGIGFVNYIPEADGTVRRVPLFMERDGRIYPQIGLALAAAMLDTDINHMRLTDHEVILSPSGKPPIVVPVYTVQSTSLNRPVPMMFDIPWFGATNGWETMYDRVGAGHLSLNVVWDACLTKRRIRQNNLQVDNALRVLYDLSDHDKLELFNKNPLPLDDLLNRMKLCRAVLEDDVIDFTEKTNLAEIKDPVERSKIEKALAAIHAVRYVIAENPKLQKQLGAQRDLLRQRLGGRALLVGWVATAQTADQVATSLDAKCPGVVVHGVIFNALMKARMWRRPPAWVDVAIILLMGGLTTLFTSRLTPKRALACTLALAVLYMGLNGIVLFAWGCWIVSMAGPMLAAALVWSGITLARFLAESAEHRRIRRRFQSYIDPTLVNYVYEHPEMARLEGQVREMTVCFTDLAGFTSFTEEYRERAVRVLGRYTSRMVPCIRRHNGLVHRFMGDGLMFSYGAPIENPNHAADAVATVLEMHEVMAEFNRMLLDEGYPILLLRAGVSTGEVVVGDTGADDACDYTCLGDVTNFAARLETANKIIGTRTLLSARTAELIGDRFLIRPIGRLLVAGKKRRVLTYEPLALAASATDEQKRLAAMTAEMVEHFWAQRCEQCIAATHLLDEAFGPSHLTSIYREACRNHLATPADEFTGQIVLDQK